MRPLLYEFSLIDSDALRQAAKYAWGTGGESTGMPGSVSSEMTVSVERVVGAVAERWHGAAFDSFKSTTNTRRRLDPRQRRPDFLTGRRTAMPSEDVHQEIDRRMRRLAANLARPPASVQDLLDTTFVGVSSAGTVTVKLDFRGALRGVHIKAGTVIPGDEQALCKAIMEAHANATTAMTTALTTPPSTTAKPEAPSGRSGRRRGAAENDVEEAGPILQRVDRPSSTSLSPAVPPDVPPTDLLHQALSCVRAGVSRRRRAFRCGGAVGLLVYVLRVAAVSPRTTSYQTTATVLLVIWFGTWLAVLLVQLVNACAAAAAAG